MKLLVNLVLLAGMSAAAHAAENVVIYGDNDYAPYSYVENGEFKGIYVEMLKKAIEKLPPAYHVELVPVPWKRGMDEVQGGSAFAIFPPYERRKDRPWIDPYSHPLYKEEIVALCNNDVMKTPRRKFPDDYAGVTFGTNSGFAVSQALTDAVKAGKVKLAEAKGNDSNIRKLAAKRIDCYVNDRGSILFSIKKLGADPEVAGMKITEAIVFGGENAFIGYSAANKAPYKADFVEKMNTAIGAVQKSGAAARILDSYLK